MSRSWIETVRSCYRVSRRGKGSFGSLDAFESRMLLSAVSVAQGAVVDAPRVYGPVQLNAADAVVAENSGDPQPIPVPPDVENYNGVWAVSTGDTLELKLNSKATKLKGKLMNPNVGNLKFKADLNGLVATGAVKGKANHPMFGKGKLVINTTFTLLNTVYWEGQYETYFKNQFLSSAMFHGDKVP
ncbi:MAG: hypothetical protein KDA68_23145 [Planctomycetaceae bacterium]|nr:hypothetical protein [Planctomycetaceae bacterium]